METKQSFPPQVKTKRVAKERLRSRFTHTFLPDLRVTFTFNLSQDNTRVTFIHKSQSSFTYFHVSLCPNHAHFFTQVFTSMHERSNHANFPYLFIYLFIYLSIYLFIYLFVYLFIYFDSVQGKGGDLSRGDLPNKDAVSIRHN